MTERRKAAEVEANMKPFAVLTLIGLLIIALGISCVVTVAESEYGIVTRFGKPVRILDEAGLSFKLPWPAESVTSVDRRLQVFDPVRATATDSEYLTSDLKNVLVNCFCVWRVKDPLKFLVSVQSREGAEDRLDDLIRSEVMATVSGYELGAFLAVGGEDKGGSQMDRIMAEITGEVAKVADQSFGIDVRSVRIKRLNFPEQNKSAVTNRMRREREKVSNTIRAKGNNEADQIRSEAELERKRILSDANREGLRIRGEADAETTRIFASAFEKDPEFYRLWRALQLAPEIFGPDDFIYLQRDADISDILGVFDKELEKSAAGTEGKD